MVFLVFFVFQIFSVAFVLGENQEMDEAQETLSEEMQKRGYEQYNFPQQQLQQYPQITPEQPCEGCKIENRCVPYGAKFTILAQTEKQIVEVPVVCTYGGITPLKEVGSYCNYNYECASNMCVKNTCVTLWLLIKSWFAKIFSFLFPG